MHEEKRNIDNYPPFRGHPDGGRGHVVEPSFDSLTGIGRLDCRICGLLGTARGEEDEIFRFVPRSPGYTALPKIGAGWFIGRPVSFLQAWERKH